MKYNIFVFVSSVGHLSFPKEFWYPAVDLGVGDLGECAAIQAHVDLFYTDPKGSRAAALEEELCHYLNRIEHLEGNAHLTGN